MGAQLLPADAGDRAQFFGGLSMQGDFTSSGFGMGSCVSGIDMNLLVCSLEFIMKSPYVRGGEDGNRRKHGRDEINQVK
jgi:hypothetical protein